MSEKLYTILSEHITARKRELFDKVADQRTRHFTMVLEDIYQAQNTSAILRSAEAWGIQDLHVIENRHSFTHHRRIARGANDWLTVHRYNTEVDNTKACFEQLRRNGYRVYVTSLQPQAIPLSMLDVSHKTAVVLGTELTGASETALQMADGLVVVPMYGFTESLNVSVAGGVIIQDMANRIRQQKIEWRLSEAEKLELKIMWARRSISWSQHIVDMFESGELL